jgi:hypothetical protein
MQCVQAGAENGDKRRADGDHKPLMRFTLEDMAALCARGSSRFSELLLARTAELRGPRTCPSSSKNSSRFFRTLETADLAKLHHPDMKRNRISTKPGQAAWISGSDAESSSSSSPGKRLKPASAGSPSPTLRDNIYVHLSQESTPTKKPAQPADPAPVSSATYGSVSRNRVGPLEWTEAWQLSDESEGASPSLKDTLRDNIYVHLSQESTPEKASGLSAAVPGIGEPFCMPQVKAPRMN